MKLRNKKSLLTRRAEGNPAHSLASKFTQKIYILILLLILLYLIYIALSHILFLEAEGQIEVEKTILSSAQGGRITRLLVKDGMRVKQNRVLLRVEADREQCLSMTDNRIQKLVLAMEANRQKRDLLNTRLLARQKMGNQGVLRRALEVEYGRADQQQKLADEIEQMKMEIGLLDYELKQQQVLLSSLKKAAVPQACQDETIHAPQNGTVHAVVREKFEVVKRGEPILNFIADDAAVHVEVYLDDEDINAVEKNKIVKITLPDGRQSHGLIKEVMSSAAMRAEREWHRYEPVKSKLAVIIVPQSPVDAGLWRSNDRMNVRMSITK